MASALSFPGSEVAQSFLLKEQRYVTTFLLYRPYHVRCSSPVSNELWLSLTTYFILRFLISDLRHRNFWLELALFWLEQAFAFACPLAQCNFNVLDSVLDFLMSLAHSISRNRTSQPQTVSTPPSNAPPYWAFTTYYHNDPLEQQAESAEITLVHRPQTRPHPSRSRSLSATS